MIVKDIMKKALATCSPSSDLASVVGIMRARDCGFPVVDRHDIVVGVITDRDICLGHLEGVLSIDDIVQAPGGGGAPRGEDIVAALKAIYARRAVEAA